MRKPKTFGPMAHGAIEAPLFFKTDKRAWPRFGVEIPASCDGKNARAVYYEAKGIRSLGEWLIKVADYVEAEK